MAAQPRQRRGLRQFRVYPASREAEEETTTRPPQPSAPPGAPGRAPRKGPTSQEIGEEEERRIENLEKFKGQDVFSIGKLSTIKRLETRLLTKEDVRALGWVEIIKAEDPDPFDPDSLQGSLYDPKMGRSSYCKHCAKCDDPACAGHSGFIDLGDNPDQREGIYVDPFLNPAGGLVVRALLNITCRKCGVPSFTKEDLIRWGLSRTPFERRVRTIEFHLKNQRDKYQLQCLSQTEPKLYNIAWPARNTEACAGEIESVKYNKDDNSITINGKSMNTTEIKQILERIPPAAAAELLGCKQNRPADLLMSFVAVLPPGLRETALIGTEERHLDYLGGIYRQIVKKKLELREARLVGEKHNKRTIETITRDLHDRILHVFSSKLGKARNPKGPAGSAAAEHKGIKEEVAGKEGHIRHITMGKRVDRSIRAAISPNPLLRFGYCTLPRANMEGQYSDIHITPWNIDILQRWLAEGKLHYYAPRKGYYRRLRFRITDQLKEKLRLIPGDVVARRLQEGDRLNLGRNPTIHKLGIMTQRIAEGGVGENTIGLHSSCTTPYNADHDGDEMHGSFPQELLALAEGRFLSDVVRNIMNSESASASMGIVMDGIIALYIMTSPDENGYYTVTEDEYARLQGLLTWRKELETLDIRLARHGVSKTSGRGIISMTLPATYNVNIEAADQTRIVIKDGILISGSLTKGNIGPSRNSFIQEVYHYYSPFRAAYFLTDLFRIANYFLSVIRSFTVGKKISLSTILLFPLLHHQAYVEHTRRFRSSTRLLPIHWKRNDVKMKSWNILLLVLKA